MLKKLMPNNHSLLMLVETTSTLFSCNTMAKKKYFRAPKEDKLILIPSVANKRVYVDIVPLKLKMTAWDGVTHDIEHDVTLVNGQTRIFVDYAAVEKNLP